MEETIQVLGIQINNLNAKSAMKNVMAYMETDPLQVIEMITMNTISKFQDVENTNEIFEMMDLVLASDQGILQASGVTEERQLKEVKELLFLKMVLRYFHKNSTRVLLLAETLDDLQKLETYMEEDYASIQIVETATMEQQGASDDMLLNLVNGAEAACVISVLPSPLEEQFISRNKMLLNARLWLGIGNLLDEMKTEKKVFQKIKDFVMRQLLKKKMAKKGDNA